MSKVKNLIEFSGKCINNTCLRLHVFFLPLLLTPQVQDIRARSHARRVALEAAFRSPDGRTFGCFEEQLKPRGATVGDATFARWRSPSSKAFGSERGSGRAAKCTTKAKRVDPRGSERSLPDEGLSCSKPPEEERRDGARSVGEHACRTGRRRGESNGPVVWSNEDPQLRRDAKWSGPTIRILYGMYSCNSTKLCRVL